MSPPSTGVLSALLISLLLGPRLASSSPRRADDDEWCCTLDTPIAAFRACLPLVAEADRPVLIKTINYTRYHDTFDGSTDPSYWNAISVDLSRSTPPSADSPCLKGDGDDHCEVGGPVCRLIDCFPLDKSTAAGGNAHPTNGGKSIISTLMARVPRGVGPLGSGYDFAIKEFDRAYAQLDRSSFFRDSYARANGSAISSLRYSNNYGGFNLTGTGNDTVYPFEANDKYGDTWPGSELRRVPCRAYGCARACVDEAFGRKTLDERTMADRRKAQACIEQCEGVHDVVNYCVDTEGGKKLELRPADFGFGSQAEMDAHVPDGCAQAEDEAFPEAAARYSATATTGRDQLVTATGAAATTRTATSGAMGGRLFGEDERCGLQGRLLLLSVGFMVLSSL